MGRSRCRRSSGWRTGAAAAAPTTATLRSLCSSSSSRWGGVGWVGRGVHGCGGVERELGCWKAAGEGCAVVGTTSRALAWLRLAWQLTVCPAGMRPHLAACRAHTLRIRNHQHQSQGQVYRGHRRLLRQWGRPAELLQRRQERRRRQRVRQLWERRQLSQQYSLWRQPRQPPPPRQLRACSGSGAAMRTRRSSSKVPLLALEESEAACPPAAQRRAVQAAAKQRPRRSKCFGN